MFVISKLDNNNNNVNFMDAIFNNTISQIMSNFDLSFCVIVNIGTYIIIQLLKSKPFNIICSTWGKRVIFLVIAIICSVVYYFNNIDIKIIFNSVILAPVSWSWIFKPICNKFNIGYKTKRN
jgi:hypothetical protein